MLRETSQKFKRPQCVQEVNCTLPLKQKSNEIIEKETTEKWSSKPQKFNTKVVWIKHYLASKWLFVTKARIYWNHDVPKIKTIPALLMKGFFIIMIRVLKCIADSERCKNCQQQQCTFIISIFVALYILHEEKHLFF